MRINNNITAANTHRQYNINAGRLSRNMERLSSGLRINRAADDAAGLGISEGMRAMVRGLRMASRNSSDGVGVIRTTESALQTTHDIMHRIRELTIQAASDIPENERETIQLEIDQLARELADITNRTEFNRVRTLDGGLTAATIMAVDGLAPPWSPGDTRVNIARDAAPGTYTWEITGFSHSQPLIPAVPPEQIYETDAEPMPITLRAGNTGAVGGDSVFTAGPGFEFVPYVQPVFSPPISGDSSSITVAGGYWTIERVNGTWVATHPTEPPKQS
ncbi:MAG: hypothetical protein FWB97_08910 [Oscillospiraceae bacterium]|nr:hypothetical protein [Oscillospiraceae bacterium]